jgi:mannose-6-phosphate isomerase-like protein (cupin superfamily)
MESTLPFLERSHLMSTVSPIAAAQPLWFIDNLAYVQIDGEQTGEAYSLVELSARGGDMPPLHVHRRDDETFYVLEGEMTLFVGDRQIAVSEGDAALAPRDVPHTYRVESEQARWLVINSPAGFERFVRIAGEPAPSDDLPPPGRPSDPAVLAQTAAEYGIEILGPPGMLPMGTQS